MNTLVKFTGIVAILIIVMAGFYFLDASQAKRGKTAPESYPRAAPLITPTPNPSAPLATHVPISSQSGPADGMVRSLPRLDSPITLTLSISHPPALGQQATLTVSIISTRDAPGTVIAVNLPPGLTLISGSPTWTADLRANQQQHFPLTIKAASIGTWRLVVSARHTVSTEPLLQVGDTQLLRLHVGAASIGSLTLPPTAGEEQTIPVTPPSR